ncbi:MAG: lysozyme inhibitor LprI family protein [Pseudomonadota bacterium]
MRSPLIIALAIGFCTAGPAFARDRIGSLSALEQCLEGSQAEMRACLMGQTRQSEAALRKAESSVLAAISKWDEDEKYITHAKDQLQLSRKRFAEYRDAQCAFHTSLGGGAILNGLEQRRLACISDLNNKQARLYLDEAFSLPSRK